MPKISELPAETTPTSDDIVPIVDLSGAVTKKLTLSALAAGIASFFSSGAISGSKLTDNTVSGAKLSSYRIKAQANATNSDETNAIIQTGWGQILGTGSTSMTKAVTFPVALTTVISVQVNFIGYKSSAGAASSIGDFNMSIGQSFSIAPYLITPTGFTAFFNGSVSFGAAYHGFTWTVIGK